jgi:hypothetical protein
MRVLLRFMLAYQLFFWAFNRPPAVCRAMFGAPLTQIGGPLAMRWGAPESASPARSRDTRVYTGRLVAEERLQKNQ